MFVNECGVKILLSCITTLQMESLTHGLVASMISWHNHFCAVARLSISIPDELLAELEQKQAKFQSFSGFCCLMLEKGLKAQMKEQEIIDRAMNAINE